MRIKVRVKPGSFKDSLTKDDEVWIIRTTKHASENQANKAVIDLISKELKIAKSKVQIISGLKSRDKLIEILC